MVKMMLERSSLYSSVCGTSSFAPCIVPTLRRGNAVVDAPASRNAGALQTEFPRWSMGTIKRAHKADREYQFWQEGVHPELVFSEAMMLEKLDYIHGNPVKRGYVSLAEHWRYSSAANYAGLEGLIEMDLW